MGSPPQLGVVAHAEVRVVEDRALDATAEKIAATTAGKAGIAIKTTKRQLTALRNGHFDAREDAAALRNARRDEEASAIGAAYIERMLGRSRGRS